MTNPVSAVDARFCQLLRHLRRRRGLSLRQLAKRVHFSHTYLWEIESGRKHATAHIAAVLDAALDAGGQLAELVTEHPANLLAETLGTAMGRLDDIRDRLEAAARTAQAWPSGATSAQWAQLASWLYDLFVRHRSPLLRLGAKRYCRQQRRETGLSPFRMEVNQQRRIPHTECRCVIREPATAIVARRLDIAPGTPVIRRENWYYADGEPVQTGTTYLPATVAEDSTLSTGAALPRGGLYACLEDLGHPVAGIRDEVTVRLPTPEETATLDLTPGVPVLDILHTSYDHQHQPFEVTRFVVRGDVAAIDYEIAVSD